MKTKILKINAARNIRFSTILLYLIIFISIWSVHSKIIPYAIGEEENNPSAENLKGEIRRLLGDCKFEEAMILHKELLKIYLKRTYKYDELYFKKESFYAKDLEKLVKVDFENRDKYLNAMGYFVDGVNQLQICELEKAKKNIAKARKILAELIGTETLTFANITEKSGLIYLFQGDFALAKQEFEIYLKLWSSNVTENDGMYSFILINLGVCDLRLGQYKTAEAHLLKAKEIEERLFGKKTLRYAQLLDFLSETLALQQKSGPAKELALEALSIAEDFGFEGTPTIGHSYANLALVSLLENNEKKARENLLASYSFFKINHQPNLQTILFINSLIFSLEKYSEKINKEKNTTDLSKIDYKISFLKTEIDLIRTGKRNLNKEKQK